MREIRDGSVGIRRDRVQDVVAGVAESRIPREQLRARLDIDDLELRAHAGHRDERALTVDEEFVRRARLEWRRGEAVRPDEYRRMRIGQIVELEIFLLRAR